MLDKWSLYVTFVRVVKAVVYYTSDLARLCLDCDGLCCDSNGNGCRGTGHRCQKLNYYSDYPSSNEFAKIWFGVGEMRDSNFRGNELSSLVTTPSLPIPSNLTYLTPFNGDSVSLFPDESSLPKLGCSNIKDLGFQGGDNLAEAIDLMMQH
ncbi:putative zinc finger protein CONSTANS-LIKE 11 [Nicotiana tomentosiformis]|uniref:putative zinc finger protein CONSTANS-LIKE 11 n=1 Tax=Nicotiana tomentosiformis TaxID=4098 RepID=UPI00388CB242